MRSVAPFLMFTGKAEEAMRFYVATFPRSRIVVLEHWGAEGPGVAGTVHQARLAIGDLELMVIDSPPVHGFSFTPSISFFVDCESADELRTVAAKLGEGGQVMMPADKYPFAELYTWLSDRFGVSWQLSYKKA